MGTRKSDNNTQVLSKGFFTAVVLALILSACGGSDGGGNRSAAKIPKKVVNPWAGIDSGSLPMGGGEVVTDQVRVLEFNDDWAIRYDGSDGEGGEELCRRELIVGDSSEYYYEVCISLEDDPYHVLIPNNALVWHPMMFDRFATDLTCYKYDKDASRGMPEAECFEGIDGVTCEAGLVNGDKALVCSDDWAVVVNGDDDDTKTVCRVHLSDHSGRCLGAPKRGVEDGDLILPMQMTGWEGYRSHRDNPQQFGVGDVMQLQTPQELPAGAELTYTSEDEAVCFVDSDGSDGGMGGGVIIEDAVAPAICRISLTIEAEGYADRVLFANLPILKPNDVAWGNYDRPNNYFYPGEVLTAEAVTSSDPASTENRYRSLDQSICTVDSETGEVTAVAVGECTVRLTAKAWDYLDVVIDKHIPVNSPEPLDENIQIDWAAFDALNDNTAVVGVAAVTLAAPEVSDNSLAVAISHVSGDCEYVATDRTLTFSDTTECVLAVTASKGRGYDDKVEEFRITPSNGTLTVSWSGYGSGAMFGSDAPALNPPSVTPTLEDVVYSYAADGGGCRVDEESGRLTIVGADVADQRSCRVTLTASRSGYDSDEVEQIVAIAKKALADLVIPDGPYGGVASSALGNGETIAMVHPPVSDEGDIAYASDDEAICTVDASGTVTPVAVGTCTIRAHTVSADNNYADSAPVVVQRIHVIAGSSSAGSWGSNPYGASPECSVPLNGYQF